jgi:hypothetical protein
MTAVFGWFFEALLCIEVKGSGAVVSAPDRTSLHCYASFYFFLFCPFLLRQKSTKKGAAKTMTAVFGWFFGELLCKEVKGSGTMFSALDLAAA